MIQRLLSSPNLSVRSHSMPVRGFHAWQNHHPFHFLSSSIKSWLYQRDIRRSRQATDKQLMTAKKVATWDADREVLPLHPSLSHVQYSISTEKVPALLTHPLLTESSTIHPQDRMIRGLLSPCTFWMTFLHKVAFWSCKWGLTFWSQSTMANELLEK